MPDNSQTGRLLIHRTDKILSAGAANPRGATLRKDGVNFSVFSRYAQEVYLLLFEKPSGAPTDVIRLNATGNLWHVYVHGVGAGQLYGYKVKGPYDPVHAMRFNEHKLLVDPYAKALTGKCVNKDNLLLAYDWTSPDKDLVKDQRDNTSVVAKCVVVDDAFDWRGDTPPGIRFEDLIIYEVHLKGFTAHPSSRVQQPGTYLGFIEKIPYLQKLGINAVELLPIHEFYTTDYLRNNGLKEYWGYNPIGYFAPESSYGSGRSPGCQVEEFKTMVRELHKAGIEVILDVVFNHTGEGNELGPTICFKGFDNSTFYALEGPPEEPYRFYRQQATGCGNTLNVERAAVRHGILDSLRYWVKEMRVDGFRFDLATVLGWSRGQFRKSSRFLRVIPNDPILKRAKMIAEPWDLSAYQYGNFPASWLQWNDRFRDTVRRFLKGDGNVKDLARVVSGSQEMYSVPGARPYNSVNFVTCHDGFTLWDLFSYNEKHNTANMENNKDGRDHNDSWNCGVEGETDDPDIIRLRRQMVKNALCCLFFSLGTPMMLGGDEFLRTQKGNNNAYCQDNEISWFDWTLVEKNADIFSFCAKLILFRKRYSILKKKEFLLDEESGEGLIPDVLWFGKTLGKPDWDDPKLKMLCYQLIGARSFSDENDYHLFLIYNADVEARVARLPRITGVRWCRVVDTSLGSGEYFRVDAAEKRIEPPDRYPVNPRSAVLLLGVYDLFDG
jgi:glycogen operon protein